MFLFKSQRNWIMINTGLRNYRTILEINLACRNVSNLMRNWQNAEP